jgi:hypothetical protein
MGAFATEYFRSGGCRISLNRQEQLGRQHPERGIEYNPRSALQTIQLSSHSHMSIINTVDNKRPKPPPIPHLPSRNKPHRIPIFRSLFRQLPTNIRCLNRELFISRPKLEIMGQIHDLVATCPGVTESALKDSLQLAILILWCWRDDGEVTLV